MELNVAYVRKYMEYAIYLPICHTRHCKLYMLINLSQNNQTKIQRWDSIFLPNFTDDLDITDGRLPTVWNTPYSN